MLLAASRSGGRAIRTSTSSPRPLQAKPRDAFDEWGRKGDFSNGTSHTYAEASMALANQLLPGDQGEAGKGTTAVKGRQDLVIILSTISHLGKYGVVKVCVPTANQPAQAGRENGDLIEGISAPWLRIKCTKRAGNLDQQPHNQAVPDCRQPVSRLVKCGDRDLANASVCPSEVPRMLAT